MTIPLATQTKYSHQIVCGEYLKVNLGDPMTSFFVPSPPFPQHMDFCQHASSPCLPAVFRSVLGASSPSQGPTKQQTGFQSLRTAAFFQFLSPQQSCFSSTPHTQKDLRKVDFTGFPQTSFKANMPLNLFTWYGKLLHQASLGDDFLSPF